MPKAILIDTTRCTACRGCQVSCKEWKNLPPVATKQRGTHQNPPDLTHANYKLVRFSEHLEGDLVKWYFFPDQCRHCLEP
ncbi:MAG: formate dehydrogenase, partial [Desulfobacteraceae bacterium]